MPDPFIIPWRDVADRLMRSLYARDHIPEGTPLGLTPLVEGLLVEIAPEPQPTLPRNPSTLSEPENVRLAPARSGA